MPLSASLLIKKALIWPVSKITAAVKSGAANSFVPSFMAVFL
jgi:hypothetical protein